MSKVFRTEADLAANGAVPAFDHVLHVGGPNISDRALFDGYIDRIYESRWMTNNGPLVQEFEEKIAELLGVKYCVALCNGTIALEIAIRALDLKGEVIVPSFTFIASAHALHLQGIRPVFADIDPQTHNLDPASVAAKVTPETTGIIGVHLWGRPAPIDHLQSIADEHGLKLIFDAAHAFGCTHQGKAIANFGECEVFSFHATKFFHSFEGGAVVTNNPGLAEKVRLMRNFGFAGLDNVICPGTNGKMPEICAAMGLSNLQTLADVLEKNRINYLTYLAEIDRIDGIKMIRYAGPDHFNYQYVVVEIEEDFPFSRNRVVEILHKENVQARRYFWPGCHEMEPYRSLVSGDRTSLSCTQQVAERVMVLPTGNQVSREHILTIAGLLRFLSNDTGCQYK